ncbi:MAG TPA: sigma factor-like helix-turn-helix DNA-binding protein [Polyangiaceae bacterium]
MPDVDMLEQMYLAGRKRWPDIHVALEDFERHCARLREDRALLVKASAFAPEVYLCCACSLGNSLAFSTLQRNSESDVRDAIGRVSRDPEFIKDTLQEFWKKMLVGPQAKVLSYVGRGPLTAWLRLCARRVAIDRKRALRNGDEQESELGDYVADEMLGPDSALLQVQFYGSFRLALQRAITSMTPKERHLLRMHTMDRCSIDQIGRAYNVHRATVARWLNQACSHMLDSVRSELELAGPRLTNSEFESVARVLGDVMTFELLENAHSANDPIA